METYASLIGKQGNNYLIQVRDVHKPEQPRGRYPFRFPGAASLFGGEIEEGETPEEAFVRELAEELPGLQTPTKLVHRIYHWADDIIKVMERADDAFHGNAKAFLGFDLDAKVPSEAAGKDRDKDLSYREFIKLIDEDHFYVGKLEVHALRDARVGEGSAARWVPHDIARSLTMVPADKLALLDNIAARVLAGELEI